jgi:hypothetical protein
VEQVIQQAPSAPQSTEASREEKDRLSQSDDLLREWETTSSEREVSQQQLINKLNSINFQDRAIDVIFRHKSFPRDITLKAYPQPCKDSLLTCRWAEPVNLDLLYECYRFHYLYVPKGQQYLEVTPEVLAVDENHIRFALPETCREISTRKLQRHTCVGITACMLQNGATYNGTLIDYGAWQFRIAITAAAPQTFRWIDTHAPVTILFTKGQTALYSGECTISRHDQRDQIRHFILEPSQQQIHRFPPREFRSTRQRLTPPPDVVFRHPLFDKTVTLKVYDLSGSGFSVEEEQAGAVLLPGLIIPSMELVFSDGAVLPCMAQVVYCTVYSERHTPVVRCGLAILNMAVPDHIRLLGLMHQATDANTYVSNKVDMEALWDFFFETGFIYPQKYEFIQANKERIKATYEKLYNESPSVASHFIYQHDGRILAHLATLRFYESSWILHHHAAIRSVHNRGGLIVLNQSGRFINESHRLASMKMDYVFCYFRPDNKFPAHVFGGAARNIKNPKICSIDDFAYFHHNGGEPADADLPHGWCMDGVREEDLHDLRNFYESQSGGLMLQCLHLSNERFDCSGVIAAFQKIGLKRERHLFALRCRDALAAVIMVNVSDVGLNMSDLTNAVTIIVVDGQYLTQAIGQTVLRQIARFYETEEMPVLLYPRQAAAQMGIESEKSYTLWVYDTQNLDHYFGYLKRLLKFIQH